jgi:predicted kinase
MARPTLIVVSGPPSSGKTTLAKDLARAIPCPAVSRDEIKEGMVHAHGGEFAPGAGDPLTQRAFPLFFDVLRLLLEAEVTVVAEAAFQDRLWRQGLEPLTDLAELRIVRCRVEAALAHERYHARGKREAHGTIIGMELENWTQTYESFEHVSISAPALDVDSSDGYAPELAEIVDFVGRR